VESVLNQSGVDVRVLILDDASPDNTPEIGTTLAREDKRVTFVRHAANKGHIATYNEGIEWASGDYMLLLSADDYLLPGALERASELLNSHKEVGFVFGRAIELHADGTETETKRIAHGSDNSSALVLEGGAFIELCWPNNIVPTPTAVVRTALQKRVGGYRTELPHAGDLEMWLRLAAHSSVGILDANQAVYRKHGTNMSEAYFGQDWLPDVKQRRLVIDCFVETCGHLLSDIDQIRHRMMRELSHNAIGIASATFNDGEIEASRRLEVFALSLSTGVMMSPAWLKLACKRSVGLARWRSIKPAVDSLRGYLTVK
jgi:glycosyltransferase involved in cell wall biosynthesis